MASASAMVCTSSLLTRQPRSTTSQRKSSTTSDRLLQQTCVLQLALHRIAPHCTTLWQTYALHCTTLHNIAADHTTLYNNALHRATSHCTTLYTINQMVLHQANVAASHNRLQQTHRCILSSYFCWLENVAAVKRKPLSACCSEHQAQCVPQISLHGVRLLLKFTQPLVDVQTLHSDQVITCPGHLSYHSLQTSME